MAVLQEILAWSQKRPAWQRDALRRLVASGDLTEKDIAEFALMLQGEKGIVLKEAAPAPTPLAAEHLALPAAGDPPVVLGGLRDLANVNALAEKQTLTFAPTGLTVVYGNNGAGKSGYVRVLKRICRARAPGAGIKRNVFKADGKAPSGTIVFRIGAEVREVPWVDGAGSPPELGAISVFDSACASVYVEDKTEVAYRPLGLDLLSKLATACDRVKRVLQDAITALDGKRFAPVGFAADGAVAKFLAGLNTTTTAAQIDQVAVLSQAERERMNQLRVQIAEIDLEGPAKRSAELRNRAGRFKALAKELTSIGERFTPEVEAGLKAAVVANQEAAAAVAVASAVSFRDQPLPSVGTPVWKRLWDAAREFSTREAYKDQPYPNVAGDAVCVLCQQPLAEAARDRLTAFERFVQDRSQAAATEAVRMLATLKQSLDGASVAVTGQATVEELGAPGTELRDAIDAFVKSAADRKLAIQGGLSANDWARVTALAVNPAPQLTALAEAAEKEAAANDAANQPAGKVVLQKELDALAERDRLFNERAHVVDEVKRLVLRAKLVDCQTDTETNAITRKSTELTKASVSDALCSTFATELKALGLSHLSVVLDPTGGAKGTLYHRVEIKRDDGVGVDGVEEVLSEGEQRCIALAAFLAELSTQTSPSAIVLDDPVSSLDHERREVIARRLVQEAKSRPVIIFTHDLVFLLTLERIAGKEGAPFAGRQLRRSSVSVGEVTDDLPWYGLPVKRRIGYLKELQVRLAKQHKEGEVDLYRAGTERLYGLLRESWERGVEEVWLNEAVLRFGREVQTQRLRKVLDITPEDFKALENGMDRCSTYNAGHDAPAEVNLPVPGPAELLTDIGALEMWIDGIRKRRAK
ncbi:MAG: AAA family ATPase [Gemmatimonadetes bacterium]|nr:AAA family ATPase [Gemmatimonadota bacterium]